jgi:hypothetical protein
VGISEDPSPSVAAPTPPLQSINVPPDQMDARSDIVEMLWSMSNNKTLKELLEFSMQWAQLSREKGE